MNFEARVEGQEFTVLLLETDYNEGDNNSVIVGRKQRKNRKNNKLFDLDTE